MQYRPTWKTSIAKNKFKRKITAHKEIQNIACFALVNQTLAKLETPDYTLSKTKVIEGDYNKDGVIDCFLWTRYDEAENCSGQPLNNLEIVLQVGKRSTHLRCCGP